MVNFPTRLVAVGLVVALGGAAALATLSSVTAPDDAPITDDSPETTDAAQPEEAAGGPATGALYLSGATLNRLDLSSGRVERIGRMPTLDVHASPSTPWLAYIVPRTPAIEQEADFIADPVLRIINTDTNKDREVGDGFNPLWHATAPKLAYLEPVADRRCSGETCEGRFKVATYDVESSERMVLTPAGRYNLLAWSGERVLFSDGGDLSVTFAVDLSGEVERIDIAPSELWDASPDGRYLVRSAPGSASLIDLASGDEAGIDVGRGVLSDGSWSPDSKRFAAALLNGPRTRARVVLVDVPEGTTTSFTDALPGVRDVRWAPDAAAFGFLTFAGATNRVEINRCSVGGGCEVAGGELRRTTLLRLE